MKRRVPDFLKRTDGSAAIEFAIVGSLFILMALATIEFARSFHSQHRMAQMADRLARVIYLNQSITETSLRQTLIDLGGSDMTLTMTNGTENGVTVRLLTLTSPRDYVSPFMQEYAGTIRVFRPIPLPGSYF